jgi:polysaccharide biosynthesis transport protein
MLKRASEAGSLLISENNILSTDSGVDLRAFLQIARRRAPMVAVFGGVAAIAALIYAQQLTPTYTAQASLLLDPPSNKSTGTETILAESPIDVAVIASQIELIRAADLAQRVVRRLELAGFDGASATNRSRELVNRLQAHIVVERREPSYIIDLKYSDPIPEVATQIVNAYAEAYLVDQLEAKYEVARRSNNWLNERLSDVRKKVEDSERAVNLFKDQNNIIDTTAGTFTDQQIAKLTEQLILARAETAQAKVALDQLRAILTRDKDPSAFADPLQSQQIGELNSKAGDMRRQLAELRSKYGTRHPSIQIASAQLADIQGQIRNITKLIITATENRLQGARKREESFETSLAQMTGTMSRLSPTQIRLRELERDANANRTLYESMLSRFKETSQDQTLQIPESRILQRATVPQIPSFPNKMQFMLLGLLIGAAVGGALAFVFEQLDRGIRTWDQVEEWIGVPVLASVPRADDQLPKTVWQRLGAKLDIFQLLTGRVYRPRDGRSARRRRANLIRLSVVKPQSAFTEAFRALRMGIRSANAAAHPRVVLISSALPDEGKSTIASNLAFHSASSGERVLLVDMDLRHPALSLAMAPKAKAGLLEVLEGADVDHLLLRDDVTGLSFLPAPASGKISSAEILGSDRLGEFLRKVGAKFDLIIIDASPLLPVTDGRMLMPVVDAFILVAHWEETDREAVAAALRQSPGAQEKLIGVVLNDVVVSKARHYDFYQSGYFMKKYPHYYRS